MTNKCLKKGYNNPQKRGKNLCEKHTAEWEKKNLKKKADIFGVWKNFINDENKEVVEFT